MEMPVDHNRRTEDCANSCQQIKILTGLIMTQKDISADLISNQKDSQKDRHEIKLNQAKMEGNQDVMKVSMTAIMDSIKEFHISTKETFIALTSSNDKQFTETKASIQEVKESTSAQFKEIREDKKRVNGYIIVASLAFIGNLIMFILVYLKEFKGQ
jgi:hypothetical protein